MNIKWALQQMTALSEKVVQERKPENLSKLRSVGPSSKVPKLLHNPGFCENSVHISSLEFLCGACCFSNQQYC